MCNHPDNELHPEPLSEHSTNDVTDSALQLYAAINLTKNRLDQQIRPAFKLLQYLKQTQGQLEQALHESLEENQDLADSYKLQERQLLRSNYTAHHLQRLSDQVTEKHLHFQELAAKAQKTAQELKAAMQKKPPHIKHL
jgi:methyl-accepting chemotaxis protein